MEATTGPYYRENLALIQHQAFGRDTDARAPGILALLEPVRARGGLVHEFGCGSGVLTRHLVEAGHRVLATDASPAMLELARRHMPGAEGYSLLTLPDDPLPPADAIVGAGHPLNYLPDEAAIGRALVMMARSLRPGGVLVTDLCDLRWGVARAGSPTQVRRGDGWLLVTEFSEPSPDRFVRDMTTFVRTPDAGWRRDDERHVNVLLDTSAIPPLLAEHGLQARILPAFGGETLPDGLVALLATR